MKKLKDYFATLSETVIVTKLDGMLLVIIGALAGVIVGMLCSPRKYTKWYNGNTVTKNWNGDEMDCIYDDEFEMYDEAEDCLPFN